MKNKQHRMQYKQLQAQCQSLNNKHNNHYYSAHHMGDREKSFGDMPKKDRYEGQGHNIGVYCNIANLRCFLGQIL
jgi:hypothetical protein